ncbi:MAG: hypothetical protein MUC59_06075 [Saprospiraceae bacterium]|jgi:hypothetical protein|nr:hypothetical protein [Saprospiraceae bacterium]
MRDKINGLGVYKNMTIGYAELDVAMSKMGFEKKSARTNDAFREEILGREIMEITYFHAQNNIKYTLLDQPGNQPVPKTEIVKISFLLYHQGIIKHFDDLAKSIEKQRPVAKAAV